MYSTETLKIEGYRNEPIPNTLFCQDIDTDHLAILLPGTRYSCNMPLLYYSRHLLLFLGADVLLVEYEYNCRPDFLNLPEAERVHWFLSDVTAACKMVSSQRPYQKVTLIGKSLGTVAMSHLLTSDNMFEKAKAVWLTPVFSNERFRKQIQQCPQQSLFVIGTADPHYDPKYLARFKADTKREILVIDGADHSLEIEDNLFLCLQVMERTMLAIKNFLGDGATLTI